MKIAYWITTALVALAYLAGGYFDIAQPPRWLRISPGSLSDVLFHDPRSLEAGRRRRSATAGVPRLKEWAYAGILFNLTARRRRISS